MTWGSSQAYWVMLEMAIFTRASCTTPRTQESETRSKSAWRIWWTGRLKWKVHALCVHHVHEQPLHSADEEQGEHGIGLGKKAYLMKELGPDTVGVMQSIKRALDPYWLMNPGKIIDYPQCPIS